MQVDALTSDIAEELNLPAGTRGVVITRIDPGSPAIDSGLQPGDVIQEVNQKSVINLDQFQTAIRNAGKQPVLLLINRNGRTSYIVISPR